MFDVKKWIRFGTGINVVLGLSLAGSLVAEGTPKGGEPVRTNPLLQKSTLSYEYPRFDLIRDEDFGPALETTMAASLREIEDIASSPAAPTFENTIVAMERSGQLFARVSSIFSNLTSCNTNEKLDALDAEFSPKFASLRDSIFLNERLFARVSTIYSQRESLKLETESNRLLERYYKDFQRAGATLSASDKEVLKGLNAELASTQTKFNQTVLKATNDDSLLITDKAELEGLDESAINRAADEATKAGHPGAYLLRLVNTSQNPLLGSLKQRAVRERLHLASLNRGSHGGDTSTLELISKLATLRARRAALLGFENYAAYVLSDQTAGDIKRVNKLLTDLAPAAIANARKEASEMQAIIDSEKGGFKLASWDWDFYSEKVRLAKYDFDESQLKPYFEAERVLFDGLFYAAHEYYGLSFKERHDLPVYEPSVRVFDVIDHDGSTLAVFILDLYARPSKRGGAWMNSYVDQSDLLGTHPVVANHLNVPKPSAGAPTLLTIDEVTTLFHEFGHALHGMFSKVTYPRFSGTNVPNDFVEYPSQVNEMWALWPEVLKHYAKHYQSGEPMPAELLKKVFAVRKFNQGFTTTEYLAASLLDQAWHQLKPDQVPSASGVLAFEAAALKSFGVDFAPVPPRYRTPYFSHSFSGDYSAAYYSYMWSEVLDADTVEWVKRNGGLTRANGDRLRATVLSRGGSQDALELFRTFSGGDPEVKPLLIRRGLAKDPAEG